MLRVPMQDKLNVSLFVGSLARFQVAGSEPKFWVQVSRLDVTSQAAGTAV